MEVQGARPYDWRRMVRRARLGPSVKLVACLLADYASPDGTSIRPGNQRLTVVSELSDKTVRTALSKLRDMGLIERTFAGSKLGRRGLADEYRLTFPVDVEIVGDLLPPEEVEPDARPEAPVTTTGDSPSEPVENPVDDDTRTAPADPGTPVNDDGTPVTDDRNTGTGYRPPTQAPNQEHQTNKTSGSGDHKLSWKTATIMARTSELDDLASEDELVAYNGAQAILSRLDDFGLELQEQARPTLDNPNIRQLAIAAARLLVNGIPA